MIFGVDISGVFDSILVGRKVMKVPRVVFNTKMTNSGRFETGCDGFHSHIERLTECLTVSVTVRQTASVAVAVAVGWAGSWSEWWSESWSESCSGSCCVSYYESCAESGAESVAYPLFVQVAESPTDRVSEVLTEREGAGEGASPHTPSPPPPCYGSGSDCVVRR